MSEESDDEVFELPPEELKVIIYEPSKEPHSISMKIDTKHLPFLRNGILLNVDGTYCEEYLQIPECSLCGDEEIYFKRKDLTPETREYLNSLDPLPEQKRIVDESSWDECDVYPEDFSGEESVCSSIDHFPANTREFLDSLDTVPVKKQKKIERLKKVKKIKQNTKLRRKLKKLRKKRSNMVVHDSQFNDDFIALPSADEPTRFDSHEVFTNVNSNQDIQPRRENRYFKQFVNSNPNPQAKKPQAKNKPADSNQKRYKEKHFTMSQADSNSHPNLQAKKTQAYAGSKKNNRKIYFTKSQANSNSDTSPMPKPSRFPAFIRNSWKRDNNRPKNVPKMHNTSANNGCDYIPFSNYRNSQPRFHKNHFIPPLTNNHRYFNFDNC